MGARLSAKPRTALLVGLGLFVALIVGAVFGRFLLRLEPARQPLTFAEPAHAAGPETNVVFVIGCTVRADQLTPYGAPTHVTPFLESVAQQGTRFDTMIAAAPWTRPAITAILSSRDGLAVGLTEPEYTLNQRALPESVTTLAEHMQRSGRTTIGLTSNPNASELFNFHQGFDHYQQGTREWRAGDVKKVPGAHMVDDALELLAQHKADGGDAFYLQLLLVDAHMPDPTNAIQRLRFDKKEPGLNHRGVGYRARLRVLDEAIQQLWQGIEDLGHDQSDTLFVFVGDHGEGLYMPRHHGKAHGNFLYPSVAHVPFIARGPGVASGHVVGGLTRHIDVLPTVLSVLDLPAEPEATGDDLQALVAGKGARAEATEAYIDTWFRHSNRVAVYTNDRFCQKDYDPLHSATWEASRARQKRAVPHFDTGCYDYRTDRNSTQVVDDPELMTRLGQWRAARAAQRSGMQPAATIEVDDETMQQLRELGYINP